MKIKQLIEFVQTAGVITSVLLAQVSFSQGIGLS